MRRDLYTTDSQRERVERDLAVYRDFEELTADPKVKRTRATEEVMRRHGIHSASTVWVIRRRVEERIRRGEVTP